MFCTLMVSPRFASKPIAASASSRILFSSSCDRFCFVKVALPLWTVFTTSSSTRMAAVTR